MSTIKANAFQTTSGAGLYPAKSWLTWGVDGAQHIDDSENISSITDTAVGKTTVNISTAYSNANYSLVTTNCHPNTSTYRGITSGNTCGTDNLRTTSQFVQWQWDGGWSDVSRACNMTVGR